MRRLQIQKIEQKYGECCLQFTEFDFLSAQSMTSVILGAAFTLDPPNCGCDFDVTTVSISWNNHLQRPGGLCQLPQLSNKKVKNIFMFMRCVRTTVQNLVAWNVVVVVEFNQRSKCFKLLVTDSNYGLAVINNAPSDCSGWCSLYAESCCRAALHEG